MADERDTVQVDSPRVAALKELLVIAQRRKNAGEKPNA